jgi:hypothetical protein
VLLRGFSFERASEHAFMQFYNSTQARTTCDNGANGECTTTDARTHAPTFLDEEAAGECLSVLVQVPQVRGRHAAFVVQIPVRVEHCVALFFQQTQTRRRLEPVLNLRLVLVGPRRPIRRERPNTHTHANMQTNHKWSDKHPSDCETKATNV